MRVGYIGCVHFSAVILKALMDVEDINICAVVTKRESTVNSDFFDLSSICSQFNIPCHYELANNREATYYFLKKFDLDVVYCFGWSYLLDEKYLTMTKHGVIGYHPAKLPENRGRHPIIWAIALGLKETASSFFKMEKGADTGPIISQVDLAISKHETAKTLYEKLLSIAIEQAKDVTNNLANGKTVFHVQNHAVSNAWRKRTRRDGLIDWRMSALDIDNLVRALQEPYPGAEIKLNENYYKVLASKPILEKFKSNIEPGKILDMQDCCFLVKVSGIDAIWLEFETRIPVEIGQYL